MCASRFEIVRPRPVPPNVRVVDESACVNGRKIASLKGGDISKKFLEILENYLKRRFS